jgi:hypothetical protein
MRNIEIWGEDTLEEPHVGCCADDAAEGSPFGGGGLAGGPGPADRSPQPPIEIPLHVERAPCVQFEIVNVDGQSPGMPPGSFTEGKACWRRPPA